MRIAQPVYEALPTLYFTIGVAAMVYPGNIVSTVLGMLLVAGGGLIWFLRKDARRGRQRWTRFKRMKVRI